MYVINNTDFNVTILNISMPLVDLLKGFYVRGLTDKFFWQTSRDDMYLYGEWHFSQEQRFLYLLSDFLFNVWADDKEFPLDLLECCHEPFTPGRCNCLDP